MGRQDDAYSTKADGSAARCSAECKEAELPPTVQVFLFWRLGCVGPRDASAQHVLCEKSQAQRAQHGVGLDVCFRGGDEGATASRPVAREAGLLVVGGREGEATGRDRMGLKREGEAKLVPDPAKP